MFTILLSNINSVLGILGYLYFANIRGFLGGFAKMNFVKLIFLGNFVNKDDAEVEFRLKNPYIGCIVVKKVLF